MVWSRHQHCTRKKRDSEEDEDKDKNTMDSAAGQQQQGHGENGVPRSERVRRASGRDQGTPSSPREKSDSDEGIWVETADDEGNLYYYHTVTLIAQWERPPGDNVVSENDIEFLEDDTTEHNSAHEEEEDVEEVIVDKVFQSLELSRSQTVHETEEDDPVTLEAALHEIHSLRQEKRYVFFAIATRV